MNDKPDSPLNPAPSPNDLLQQRLMAEAAGLGSRPAAKPAPAKPAHPMPDRRQSGGLAGEGVRDTDELLRLVALLKHAEVSTGSPERTIVIGEFSVTANRVPETYIAGLQALTRAEASVLRMLGWGRANNDIAMLLDSNENTVRTHMNNVIRKLDLDGMRELITLAGLLFHPLD
jgi:DNA-binding CsgD family transcriptional regulator